MEKWMKRTVDFASGLFFTGKINPSVVTYIPSKLEVSSEEKPYFPRVSAEEVGVSSGRLIKFMEALEGEQSSVVHNLLCIKDGKVILECSHPGYSVNTWHLSHSMSKVLVSLAIGFLVSDGVITLDDKILNFFRDAKYRDERFEDITLRHLLSMTSGVRFGEAGVISESDWTEAFFNSALLHSPGERFDYNSMNTYILGCIVVKLTGKSLTDFLTERLLTPLKITNFFWELGPEGIEKGGFGVFMSCESWAKIGMLFLNNGKFEGKEIISSNWISESIMPHVSVPDNLGDYNYGYKVWVSKHFNGFLFSGMLGQTVSVFPGNNMIIAVNSGNNELFQSGATIRIIERFFAPDISSDIAFSSYHGSDADLKQYAKHFFERRHWVRPLALRKGLYSFGLTSRSPYPAAWSKLLGSFDFPKNNQGILPTFIRTMQNNLGNSIERISFVAEGKRIFFICDDGAGKYKLEVGFYDFASTVIDVGGEKYIVKVIAEATEDIERKEAFKLEILFPEMPNTRKILFTFEDNDRINMRLYELPDAGLVRVFSDEILKTNNPLSPLITLLEERLGKNYFTRKINEVFDKTLLGARVGSLNYHLILEDSRKRQKSDDRSARIIDSIIYRFVSEENNVEDKISLKNIIGGVVERLKPEADE